MKLLSSIIQKKNELSKGVKSRKKSCAVILLIERGWNAAATGKLNPTPPPEQSSKRFPRISNDKIHFRLQVYSVSAQLCFMYMMAEGFYFWNNKLFESVVCLPNEY